MIKLWLLLLHLLLFNLQQIRCETGCPVEDDPTNLARCIQFDASSIVLAIKGDQDFTSFCALASRYLECIKTYTRGCIGYFFGEGAMTELQNIAMHCCRGFTASLFCPFNPNVSHKCIDSSASATLADGSTRSIGDLQIGDQVKTLDSNGKLVDTDVVMIMDISHQESLFFDIRTYSNKSVKVSASHLVALPNGEFKFARQLNREDLIVTYDFEKQTQVEERIKSILIEPVASYSAPLTMSGTILVDGILLSCYAAINSHTLAHAVMAPARWSYSMHELAEAHLPDSLSTSLLTEKQSNGTHWYPAIWASFTSQYVNQLVKIY